MNEQQSNTIRAEAVAAKLASIFNHEQPAIMEEINNEPRYIELLWFIQWMAMQPGGLPRFTEEFLKEFGGRIGTETMRSHETQRSYTAPQCAVIWSEIPSRVSEPAAIRANLPIVEEVDLLSFGSFGRYSLSDWRDDTYYDPSAAELLRREREEKEAKRKVDAQRQEYNAGLTRLNRPFFERICFEAAKNELPGCLVRLCTDPSVGFATEQRREGWTSRRWDWWFHDIAPALLEYMAVHAARVRKRIATTTIVEKVVDALEYACSERVMVQISGDSRFGKTESIETWAEMHPGRARLVRVPCTNADGDLYRAVAEAFGLEFKFNAPSQQIRERVEYILRHARVMIVFDEGHFLIQQRYSHGTPPMRLNWVRTQLVDRGLPVAIVTTPQSFNAALNRFVKKTGYTIEQFLGRSMLNRELPSVLTKADMIAVAKVQFPELDDDDDLQLIVARAMQSESFLKVIEAVAKRARYIAKQKGRKISSDDVDAALADYFPETALQSAKPALAKPVKRHSKGTPMEAPKRFTAPVSSSPEREELLACKVA